MDNYTIINGSYEANEGYCFRNIATGNTFDGMYLADGDNIENYEVIERPIEPIIEEPTEEINENENLTDSERITNLEEQVRDILSKEQ